MIERDPDIAALAARFGLRRLAYRSFARPAMAEPGARIEGADIEAETTPSEPLAEAVPPATMATPPPAPTVGAGVMPMTAAGMAPDAAAPMPFMAMRLPPPAVAPHAPMPQPMLLAAVPIQFPLLVQALAGFSEAKAGPAVPPSAQPFLDLAGAVSGARRQAEG